MGRSIGVDGKEHWVDGKEHWVDGKEPLRPPPFQPPPRALSPSRKVLMQTHSPGGDRSAFVPWAHVFTPISGQT